MEAWVFVLIYEVCCYFGKIEQEMACDNSIGNKKGWKSCNGSNGYGQTSKIHDSYIYFKNFSMN